MSSNAAGSGDEFYRALPELEGFSAAFEHAAYRDVPADWIVAATDVIDSTRAIAEGRYKDVTIAGAVGTIALGNYLSSLDFPFFFGGDGMFFLLPGRHLENVLDLLADTRRTVADVSGLHLRAGVVPVAQVYREGGTLAIGRVRVSPRYVQAVARGDGLEIVDRKLKGIDTDGIILADGDNTARLKADFRGFSCRWQDIPSHRGETLSLIVTCSDNTGLQQVQQVIDNSLDDPATAHPLVPETQTTSGSGLGPQAEARFLSRRARGMLYRLQRARIAMEVMVVRFASWSGLPIRAMGKRLNQVPEDNIRNSDVRKLDGTLKMVLAVSPEERKQVVENLDRLRREGRVEFGYHVSNRAIMTCLIHTNHEDEVHFVDAADGGYAVAAAMLKERLAER